MDALVATLEGFEDLGDLEAGSFTMDYEANDGSGDFNLTGPGVEDVEMIENLADAEDDWAASQASGDDSAPTDGGVNVPSQYDANGCPQGYVYDAQQDMCIPQSAQTQYAQANPCGPGYRVSADGQWCDPIPAPVRNVNCPKGTYFDGRACMPLPTNYAPPPAATTPASTTGTTGILFDISNYVPKATYDSLNSTLSQKVAQLAVLQTKYSASANQVTALQSKLASLQTQYSALVRSSNAKTAAVQAKLDAIQVTYDQLQNVTYPKMVSLRDGLAKQVISLVQQVNTLKGRLDSAVAEAAKANGDFATYKKNMESVARDARMLQWANDMFTSLWNGPAVLSAGKTDADVDSFLKSLGVNGHSPISEDDNAYYYTVITMFPDGNTSSFVLKLSKAKYNTVRYQNDGKRQDRVAEYVAMIFSNLSDASVWWFNDVSGLDETNGTWMFKGGHGGRWGGSGLRPRGMKCQPGEFESTDGQCYKKG